MQETLARCTLILATLVGLLGAGCDALEEEEIGVCPKKKRVDETCVSEGNVSYQISKVAQAEGAVFVSGEMKWSPCSMIPGKHDRSYRIDPATGATTRMDPPATAEPVSMPPSGKIEVTPGGSPFKLSIERAPSGSVSKSSLTIGALIDSSTGEKAADIQVASVCDG